MKKLVYRTELAFVMIWIPIVILIFQLIPEKRIASVFAGIGFIFLPLAFIAFEFSKIKTGRTSLVHLGISIEFLFLSSLPIFLLRVMNWNSEFNNLELFGVSANSFHRFSNLNYMILIVSTSYMAFKELRNEKSQPLG
ncbi:MAG: hypothetical protein WA160_17085 [Pseudobdellovibrio sp.]